MKVGFSLISLCMGLNISANAAPSCKIVYHPQSKIIAEKPVKKDFWSQETIRLEFEGGKQRPLTFSLDSEVNSGDAYRLILTDPQALASLQTSLVDYVYHKSVIQRVTGLSDAQFALFALRKGVPADRSVYQLTDLNAQAFQQMVSHDGWLKEMQAPQVEALNIMLKNKGISLKAGPDNNDVEVRHSSSETKPSALKKLVEGLHSKAKRAMTHLHIGIPAEVSDAKVAEIARAVEADAILSIAKDARIQREELPYTDFSTLSTPEPKNTEARGVIRLGFSEFHEPFIAHNLEVRQYGNLNHGFALVEKASLLAKNHDRLIVTSPHFNKIKDLETSNLPGALYHVGTVLSRSKDASDRAVAQQLLAFSEQIFEHGAITDNMRYQVADFLNQAKPLQRLKFEYYLNP